MDEQQYSTKECLIIGAIVAVLFLGAVIWWQHSPTFIEEKAYQRRQAVAFLRQHQWDMLPYDVVAVMKAYNISLEEIKPFDLTQGGQHE